MNSKKMYLKAHKQFEIKNYDAALRILDKIKKGDPKFPTAYYLEAIIWHELKNSVKEYYALEKIIPLLDTSKEEGRKVAAEIFSHMGDACSALGLIEESTRFNTLSMKLVKFTEIISVLIFGAHLRENSSVADFQALYDEYKSCLADIAPYPRKFYAHEKIRVGFLSADFRRHAVFYWSCALLTKLDKNRFETYFYSSSKSSDVVTENLQKTANGWRDISALTDKEAAKIIHDDEIDILFDLSGHSEGTRLPVMAYRPASVQMSGVGYMNSTGLDCVDYFLSDIYCAGDEAFFAEKVIKLPHSHICYEPQEEIAPAPLPPCIKNGYVTFGCFNKFAKITDSILIAWKKILDAVPNSRLILKNDLGLTEDGINFTNKRLKNFGFDLNRVEIRPFGGNYLVEYGDIDIAPDTFPYTGGVTTCDALYMGVPVVSLYGARHGTRFGLSILKNIRLDELAVDSYDDYIQRAIMLAGDWELLTLLRKNIRAMMLNSAVMNWQIYIRDVERAFIKILNDERSRIDD